MFPRTRLNPQPTPQNLIDSMCDKMCDIVHDSCSKPVSDAPNIYQGRYSSKSWWNQDCTITRDRQRFWFRIWKSCDRPRTGQVYLCYKSAKKAYRASCNRAMNTNLNELTLQLNHLYRGRNFKRFWNRINRIRRGQTNSDDISLQTLDQYFRTKFETRDVLEIGDSRTSAKAVVDDKYRLVMSSVARDKVISTSMVKKWNFYMGKYIHEVQSKTCDSPKKSNTGYE